MIARLWPRKPVVTFASHAFASHEYFGYDQQECIVVVNGTRERRVHWFRDPEFPDLSGWDTDICELCPITMRVPCDDLTHHCQPNVKINS